MSKKLEPNPEPDQLSDILVVGAGVVGAAIAFELASRGAKVTVLERGTPGGGATHASAGMLVPYVESTAGSVLRDVCAESLRRYDDFLDRLQRVTRLRVEYERSGTLLVAFDAEEQRHLQADVASLAAAGVACEFLDGRAVRDAEPALADAIIAGAIVHEQGFVAAGALTRALLDGARQQGASIETGIDVHRVAAHRSFVECETSLGTRRAGHVVIANGCWSGQLRIDGQPTLPVRPVRGQLLYLARQERVFSRIVWAPGCYMVPWSDGSVLVGATVEDAGFDQRVTADGVSTLLEASLATAPSLKAATFVGARVGLRPATPDELPIIGASALTPRIVYATGHYRNGVLLAPITATMVADLILDGRLHQSLAALGPDRFGESRKKQGSKRIKGT